MPNDLKKKAADLTPNLNDSSEIDCVSISDDEMATEEEMIEIPVFNDRFEAENSSAMASFPNDNFTESGTQTVDIQWCNIAAHCCAPSNAQSCDKETQTVQSQNIVTHGEIVARSEGSPLNFISTGTQTIDAGSCNIAAHSIFSLSDAQLHDKYTQTEAILQSDAALQLDSKAVKLENELVTAKQSLKRLNSRLGDEMIGTDSSDSSDSEGDDDSTSRDEENFSDVSDCDKQFDHRFSLKYGFITNVRGIIIM